MIDIPKNLSDIVIGEPSEPVVGRNSIYMRKTKAIIELMAAKPGQWALVRDGMTRAVAYTTQRNYQRRFTDVNWRVSHTDDNYSLWLSIPKEG